MSRLPFLPARNSRHRIAALSLYRALLRSADKIALPTDVRGADSKHAIGRMIKKQFLKNRQLTSFRLVYASIAAGYKFLSLFAKAHNSSSPEYAQLLAYLRARPARGSACRPRQVLGKPEEPAREPFLKNVSGSDEPRYVATMGPGTLKGRIPHLCATADGQPFIRLRNPQPRALSKMVGRKGEIFRTKMAKMMAATEELAQDAALEDDWDDLVAEQRSREESTAKDAQAPVRPEYPSTFTWTAQLTRLWWEWQIEKTITATICFFFVFFFSFLSFLSFLSFPSFLYY
ncbi:hypothetical protein UVI_02013560 [Ustilaginoidea virens]|uniref:Complex 1 LYR protein domain-containing protein n=1 Tax=Ustilaginoidea virens TaxID=1159556 RepID=A0A1B5KRG3_USTVR|nr:hypothetical protein UVI_02013560 [Ustilaginoidea virens]